jgi:hypothetical protein
MGELEQQLRQRIEELEREKAGLPPLPPLPPPIPTGLSKARFLFEGSKRRGVTTQWLKDLGYTVEPCSDPVGWTLVPPTVPEALQAAADEALAEILAVSKIVVTEDGPKLELPQGCALWIVKVARGWRG